MNLKESWIKLTKSLLAFLSHSSVFWWHSSWASIFNRLIGGVLAILPGLNVWSDSSIRPSLLPLPCKRRMRSLWLFVWDTLLNSKWFFLLRSPHGNALPFWLNWFEWILIGNMLCYPILWFCQELNLYQCWHLFREERLTKQGEKNLVG